MQRCKFGSERYQIYSNQRSGLAQHASVPNQIMMLSNWGTAYPGGRGRIGGVDVGRGYSGRFVWVGDSGSHKPQLTWRLTGVCPGSSCSADLSLQRNTLVCIYII